MIEKIKYLDSREVEHKVKELGSKTRDKILSKYIDVNKFMNSKNNDQDLTEMVKPDKEILDFTIEVLETGIEGLDLDDISGKEKDRLFEKFMGHIMGFEGDTKN